MADFPAYTTLVEAAKLLDVPYYTLQDKVKKGIYPAVKFRSRYYVSPALLYMLIHSSVEELEEIENTGIAECAQGACTPKDVKLEKIIDKKIMNFVDITDSDALLKLLKSGHTLSDCLLTIDNKTFIGYMYTRRL